MIEIKWQNLDGTQQSETFSTESASRSFWQQRRFLWDASVQMVWIITGKTCTLVKANA
jgi:hypothetical protein